MHIKSIYLIQHCQSEHHVNELTGGWTDTPLTALGLKQAQFVAKELASRNLKDFKIMTSDLKRAKMTANAISEIFNVPVKEEAILREINNGEAANKTKAWAEAHKLTSNNDFDINARDWQNAETPLELYNRMQMVIKNHLLETKTDLIIVSHGVALRYLVSAWLGISVKDFKDTILHGNAGSISVLKINHNQQRFLSQFNHIAHLTQS